MTTYYFGTINKIINRLTYEVLIDIDGIVDKKPAFPFSRGEMDEPKVGDKVVLHNIDPLYGSMYLYTKLKEDEFVGFRSNGKAVEITPDYIEMSVFKFKDSTPGENESQDAHDEFGNWYTRVKMTKDGDIIISAGKGKNGNINISVYGDTNINTKGDTNISSDGNINIDSPKVTLKGLQSIPGVSGALNCIKVCPLTGVTHSIDFGISTSHSSVNLD